MAENGKIELQVSEDEPGVAYLRLPAHPGRGTRGAVQKTLSIYDLLPNYCGPDLEFDFDANGELIGVEILA